MDAVSSIFDFRRGQSPLLISFPHDGTTVPDAVMARFTDIARELRDTDWHVAELYRFIGALDVSFLRARWSRYLVDLNRPPERAPLYPGHFETSICPVTCFSLDPVYLGGAEPDDAEIDARIRTYWQPYHDHIRAELDRLRAIHGFAVLLDAHSVAGQVPSLFQGELPDLNFGTHGGASCAAHLADAALALAKDQSRFSCVLNGRFKGGYITRHYGSPGEGVHAIQLEINQNTYLARGQFVIDEARADTLRGFLRPMVEAFMDLRLPGADS